MDGFNDTWMLEEDTKSKVKESRTGHCKGKECKMSSGQHDTFSITILQNITKAISYKLGTIFCVCIRPLTGTSMTPI